MILLVLDCPLVVFASDAQPVGMAFSPAARSLLQGANYRHAESVSVVHQADIWASRETQTLLLGVSCPQDESASVSLQAETVFSLVAQSPLLV